MTASNEGGKSHCELLAQLASVTQQRDRLTSLLEIIMQASFDVIVSVDANHIVTGISSGAERALGYTAQEMIGQPVANYLQPDQLAEFKQNMKAIAEGRLVQRYRTQRTRKDGTAVNILSTVGPIKNAANEIVGAVAIAQDLTEIQRLEQQVVLAQKMEAVGRLAGGVAHDFNNLLTVINGYSELLLAGLAPDDPIRESLSEIYNAGDRAHLLTRQLLAFSRQQVLEPEVLDLNAVISETEKMLRRLIGADIILTHKPQAGLGTVKVDRGQLQQILMNLVVNARDAMPQGGSLIIETANVRFSERDHRAHPGAEPGEYTMLAVTDTGVGMDDTTKARIFDPFFTTKEPGKGTGLGLPVVYGIVKQSGGWIDVDTQPGVGTTFKIFLPRAGEAVRSARLLQRRRTRPHGHETILLVENDDAVRALAKRVLDRCGYTVREATNGKSAVEFVATYEGPLDLVVSDMVMPHIGGRDLANQLRTLRPGLKVLFFGYADDAAVRHGVTESEVGFLQKPFTTSGLAQKVRDLLDASHDQ